MGRALQILELSDSNKHKRVADQHQYCYCYFGHNVEALLVKGVEAWGVVAEKAAVVAAAVTATEVVVTLEVRCGVSRL